MESSRRPRKDAQRNRALIIEVAGAHLGRDGVSTSLEAIAQDAGVGVGTLYRHFPDREALLAAVLETRGQALEEAFHRLEALPAGYTKIDAWLQEIEDYLGTIQGLPGPLVHAMQHSPESRLGIACQEIVEHTGVLLREAQQAGEVARTVEAKDLFNAMLMLTWLRSHLSPAIEGGDRSGDVDRLRTLIGSGIRGADL